MSQEDPKIEIVFDLQGENAGLTEEFIYENQPSTDGESIEILSSATVDSNRMGVINKNAKLQGEKLKTFSAPCILVARNGFAGTMKYIETGNFTINDHAYGMTLRPNWKEKVNLRWFAFQYQELFLKLITSKSDNATFSKEYAERQKVQLPDISIQDRIVDKLDIIDVKMKELDKVKAEIVMRRQSKIVG